MLVRKSNEFVDVTLCMDPTKSVLENIELAMQPGFSTASKEVREMGFGAGMGLSNIKKNTDELKIESRVNEGTTLTFRCYYS